MRIKKWEKWYWGIAFVIWIGLIVWIITWDRGFVFTKKSGETTEKNVCKTCYEKRKY